MSWVWKFFFVKSSLHPHLPSSISSFEPYDFINKNSTHNTKMTKSFKLSIALLSSVLFSNGLSLISALRITYPTQDSVLNPSIPTNLTWEYLPTDPLFFDIQLLNTTSTSSNGFAVTIKESQSSNTGFFTLPTNHSLSNGLNYQFVLISSNAALPGILAQSPQFKISSNSSNQTSTNNSVPLPSSYKPIHDANSSANSISSSLNHSTLIVTLVVFFLPIFHLITLFLYIKH